MSIYAKTAAGWVEVAGGASKAALSSWGRVVGEPADAITDTYFSLKDGSNWQYWEFNKPGDDYEIDLGNGGLFWVLCVGGGAWPFNSEAYLREGQPGLVNEGLWEFGPGVHTVTVGSQGTGNGSPAYEGRPSFIGDYGTQGETHWGSSNGGRGATSAAAGTGYKSSITGNPLEYATGYAGLDRPGRGSYSTTPPRPGTVIIATRIDVEQLAPAPAVLAPAPVLGAPVKVSGTADVVNHDVRQKDGSRKKIYMLRGNTAGGVENVFEVTLGAGVLPGVMVGGGGQGANQGAGGAGGVIGQGAHVPVILPVQGTATYTVTVASTNWSTDTGSHTRPGLSTTIAVQGQEPFAVAPGGGDGVGTAGGAAIGGGQGASGGGAGNWQNEPEFWGSGAPGIPGYGHKGGANTNSVYGGGGGYGDPLQRDLERVMHDVTEKWITKGHAETVYGVVFEAADSLEIDHVATEKKRAAMTVS